MAWPGIEILECLRNGAAPFLHLDAAQLVKHAFGLRTAVHRTGRLLGKKPVLFYLYAEPIFWPNGSSVDMAHIDRHRTEVGLFATEVAGDEVDFVFCSYRDLLRLSSQCRRSEYSRSRFSGDSAFRSVGRRRRHRTQLAILTCCARACENGIGSRDAEPSASGTCQEYAEIARVSAARLLARHDNDLHHSKFGACVPLRCRTSRSQAEWPRQRRAPAPCRYVSRPCQSC